MRLLRCFIIALACFFLTLQRAAAQNDAAWIAELRAPRVQKAALNLARQAAKQWLTRRKITAPPADLPAILRRRVGVFVTIEKRGQVAPRGCRGTIAPITDSLAQEIVRNTIAACTRDAQQPPLRRDELAQCLISLTVVTRLQPISSINQHDATRNGLVAQNGNRVGVVLPYEGRDAKTQLAWARRKAALRAHENAQLFELFATRFRENAS